METFYLVDFENVHNEGIENVDKLSKADHVHIFSTENALNIRMDIVFSKGIDMNGHIVPVRKQSLDMHLVSYLGFLLGTYGKQSKYIIVSNDKDYDNIIRYWREEGYVNVLRESKILSTKNVPKEEVKKVASETVPVTTHSINARISAGMNHKFSGEDRSELNLFVQRELAEIGYERSTVNKICSCVIAHCNDERMLSGIHNDLKNGWKEYGEIYEDVKIVLDKFVRTKSENAKKEQHIRIFFGRYLKEQEYVKHKEEIVKILLESKTKQQINNQLLKLYSSNTVKQIYEIIQPLIKGLPGK